MSTRPTYATVVRHGAEVSLQRALSASVPETTIDVKTTRYRLGRSEDRRSQSFLPYPVGPGNQVPSRPYELHPGGPQPDVYHPPPPSDVWPQLPSTPSHTSTDDYRYDSPPAPPRRNTERRTLHPSDMKRFAPRSLQFESETPSDRKHAPRRTHSVERTTAAQSAAPIPHAKQVALQKQQERAKDAGKTAEARVDEDVPTERQILMLAIYHFMTEVQNMHKLLQVATKDAMLDGNETRRIAETAAEMLAYAQKLIAMNVGLLKPDILSVEQKQAIKRDLAEGARLLTHDVQVLKISEPQTEDPIPSDDPLQLLSDSTTPKEGKADPALEAWMKSVLNEDDGVNAMFEGMSLQAR